MSQQQRPAAMLPRVACVSDLSGFGRCSLAVALPILSAMGFQACPLPTVLLSAHTGYEQPYIRDLTADIAPYLAHWQHIGLQPDAVFTGFLGNERQVSLLEPLLQQARQRGAPVLVDPAMADHGRLYSTCTPALAAAMRRLLALQYLTGLVVVLKGHRTLVAAPGRPLLENRTGNPGMATGGSGDALAGVIGALLAQGMEPYRAAMCGVFLHGAAGDAAAARLSQHAMLPTDLIDELGGLFLKLEK